MLPEIQAGMTSLVIPNPVLENKDLLISRFEDIESTFKKCKFSVIKTSNRPIEHYTFLSIEEVENIDKQGIHIYMHKVKADSLEAASAHYSQSAFVLAIANGPETINIRSAFSLMSNVNVNKNKFMIHENEFISFNKIMAYLGQAVIKHGYFWSADNYASSLDLQYYKDLSNHLLSSIKSKTSCVNAYDYSMNFIDSFGHDGSALMDIFEMKLDQYDHFVSMVYCECKSLEAVEQKIIELTSYCYNSHPFKISVHGSDIIITRLHTYEHYLYMQYQELIEKYKKGLVEFKKDDNNE